MSKTKKAPPFDVLDTAVKVRAGQLALSSLTPEQQMDVRQKLSHTGRLQTELLRHDVTKPKRQLPPATHFHRAIAG